MAKDFSWDQVRECRRARRRLEGATEEVIASEEIPADRVVWSPGQLANIEKSRKPAPRSKPRLRSGPAKGSEKKVMDDVTKRRILALNASGWGNGQIAREVGFSTTSVKTWLQTNNRQSIDGRSTRYDS